MSFSFKTSGFFLRNECARLRSDAASIPLAAAASRISAPAIRKTDAGFHDNIASPPFPNSDSRMLIFSLHNIALGLQSRCMNAKQENRFTMYLAVTAACDKDQTAWKDLAAFANSYAKFKTCVANIKSLAEAQERQSGAAEEKQILRQDMASDAAVVAGAVGAWAAENKKNDIAKQVNYSEYDLMAGRDTASAAKCQIILDAARDNAASLVGYLQDAADALDALEKKSKPTTAPSPDRLKRARRPRMRPKSSRKNSPLPTTCWKHASTNSRCNSSPQPRRF